MVLNSLQFALFFLIFLAVLLMVPKKLRKYWLLIGNCAFYLGWNRPAFLLLLASSLLTWVCGLGLEKDRKKRILIAIPVFWTVGLLVFFKFSNYIDPVFRKAGASGLLSVRELIIPVGISFYLLRCISYTVDISRGVIHAKQNPLDVILYVSFFPQIISGPIERPGSFFHELASFEERAHFSLNDIWDGFLLFVWGLFQKLVLAERLTMIASTLYGRFENHGFWELLIASLAYTLEIYCDFGGYSDMSRGIARMMGFSTVHNFQQPYLASDIKSFWRRWHISLTSWLTDYIYIPLGGSRKGLPRKYLNIVIVFVVSGLWHGSTLNFIFWGLLHAGYQIIQDLWQRTGKHLPKWLGWLITISAVDFAWIFFNAGGLNRGFRIVRQMFTRLSLPAALEIGLVPGNLTVLMGGLAILLAVDLMRERGLSIRSRLAALPLPLRWLLILALFWSVIMLGIYGVGYDTTGFIYAQF